MRKLAMTNRHEPEHHRNDIYGDIEAEPSRNPVIPAATVIPLRDGVSGVETLMLRKNSKIAFGGMWVFPGGKIDPEDHTNSEELEDAARVAAAREALEEAALRMHPSELVWFAHWSPPPSTPKRFATYFFVAHTAAPDGVSIDGGEILDHCWIAPAEALERHREGEIDLAPPTWVSLFHLSRYSPVSAAIEHLRSREPSFYATRIGQRRDGVRVALWNGDAGYDNGDADAVGPRHRLSLAQEGFEFEFPEGFY